MKARIITADAGLPLKLWLEIIRAAVYLYNHTLSKSTLKDNGEELISPIISLFWELDTDCFSLLYHIEYYYLRVYRYQTFIYISKNIKVQS